MDYLLRRLVKVATRRGMRGEHWAWFALAAGAYVLQRARRSQEPVVVSRRMHVGEQLLVTIRPPKGGGALDEPAGS
ncbi:MAG TPA: hypothetical protein VEJ44_02460 [Acidimicrobiales bacterium]|nr:hypothetical protein [Acidimicrobiales bacterium]